MALIPEIDAMLEVDEKNVANTRVLFSRFSPDLPDALNTAAVLFRTAMKMFGQGVTEPYKPATDYMDACNVDLAGFLALAKSDPKAKAIMDEMIARQMRAMLLGRLGILWAYTVADFLRMRVTAPLSFMRVQCESLAIMRIMVETPAVSQEWRSVMTDAEGRSFFSKHKRRISELLTSYQLEFAYNQGSGVAMHSRFSGTMLGLRLATTTEVGLVSQSIEMRSQEIDPENPDLFLMFVLSALRTQERIFVALRECGPEFDDLLFFDTRVPRFREQVDGLFQMMAKARPDLLKRPPGSP